MTYLWLKTLHIVFIASWFAGLCYLPRIFVNLAEENQEPVRQRLLGMARRLYRFTGVVAIPALIFGAWLWLGVGIGKGPGNGWLHAKLMLVLLMIGYHHGCGVLLKKFEAGASRRSGRFFRWFNEIPVVLMFAIVAMVIFKPF